MRGLYKATAMLVLDETLRRAVSERANVIDKPELKDPILRPQPDLEAIKAIDNLLRARGVFLPIYDLCEINRWFIKDKDPEKPGQFSQALASFADAVKGATAVGSLAQSAGFLEAVGVTIVDPLLRAAFATGSVNLSDLGFLISQDEELALRAAVTPGSVAETLANKILRLGWDSIACTSRYLPYPGLVHSNR